MFTTAVKLILFSSGNNIFKKVATVVVGVPIGTSLAPLLLLYYLKTAKASKMHDTNFLARLSEVCFSLNEKIPVQPINFIFPSVI